MKPIIIFDFDGTLVDSISTIVDALLASAQSLNVDLCPQAAQHVIGLGLPQASAYLYPEASPAFLNAFVEGYKSAYIKNAHLPKPYDGIVEMLNELKSLNLLMAIATGKSRVGLDRALNDTNWHHYFAATRTADKTASKPDPLMIHEILETLNHRDQQVIMVGDTTHDIDLAHNANALSIGVTFGAHSRDQLELSKPWRIVDSAQALQNQLMSIIHSKAC